MGAMGARPRSIGRDVSRVVDLARAIVGALRRLSLPSTARRAHQPPAFEAALEAGRPPDHARRLRWPAGHRLHDEIEAKRAIHGPSIFTSRQLRRKARLTRNPG